MVFFFFFFEGNSFSLFHFLLCYFPHNHIHNTRTIRVAIEAIKFSYMYPYFSKWSNLARYFCPFFFFRSQSINLIFILFFYYLNLPNESFIDVHPTHSVIGLDLVGLFLFFAKNPYWYQLYHSLPIDSSAHLKLKNSTGTIFLGE